MSRGFRVDLSSSSHLTCKVLCNKCISTRFTQFLPWETNQSRSIPPAQNYIFFVQLSPLEVTTVDHLPSSHSVHSISNLLLRKCTHFLYPTAMAAGLNRQHSSQHSSLHGSVLTWSVPCLTLTSALARSQLEAAGLSDISAMVLRACVSLPSLILTHIYNLSEAGDKILLWKTSCLVPLPKNWTPLEFTCNNYQTRCPVNATLGSPETTGENISSSSAVWIQHSVNHLWFFKCIHHNPAPAAEKEAK